MNQQPAQAGAPPADQQPALAGDHRWHPAIRMELIKSLIAFHKLFLKTEGKPIPDTDAIVLLKRELRFFT